MESESVSYAAEDVVQGRSQGDRERCQADPITLGLCSREKTKMGGGVEIVSFLLFFLLAAFFPFFLLLSVSGRGGAPTWR